MPVTYDVEVRETQIRRAFLRVTLEDENEPSPESEGRAVIAAELWDYDKYPVNFSQAFETSRVRPADGEIMLLFEPGR